MATSEERNSLEEVPDSVIVQFCAVTGSDQMVARQMLEACGGSLEVAIGMHMDSTGEASVPNSSPNIPPLEDQCTNEVRAPIPQKREVLVDETFTFGLRGRRRPARSVFDGFRDFQAETRQQEMERAGVANNNSKRQTLEDLFRPPIDLMHKGSFHSARDAGTSESKWLLVNIQNVQEFQCQALNRDIWSHSAVKCMVREHFIFWQVYHDSEEGRKYVQFYPVKEWPYIAILDPRTGENLVVWHQIDVTSFCDLVSNFLNEHPSFDGSSTSPPCKKMKRSDSIVDASEESQIKAAITASLNETTTSHSDSVAVNYSDSDSEVTDGEDDLETFTDSESEASCTLTKPPLQDCMTSENSKCQVDKNRSVPRDLLNKSPCLSTYSDQDTDNSCQSNCHLALDAKSSLCQPHSHKESVEERHSSVASSTSPSHKDIAQSVSWKVFLGDERDDRTKLMIRFPNGKKQQLSIPCSSQLQLEQRDMGAAQALRAAFAKVEQQHPGFAYDLIKGVLREADLQGQVEMRECLLRLEGMNNSEEFRIARAEAPFQDLNHRAASLKKILSRIPDEIYDRKKFLETIKDIASAIKNLLDAVNSVFIYIEGQSNKQSLEQRKREFVKYSKRFSNTLKEFFKDNQKHDVFMSANYLINQSNLIMRTVKESC